ncbi:carbon storage regulator CsrA [Clostridium sp. JNZ J1-5]
MLVIKRKEGEGLILGDDIEIKVVSIENGSVKIAIEAPKSITILRKELYNEIQEQNKKSVVSDLELLKSIKK